MSWRTRLVLSAGSALLSVALFAAACGDDGADSSSGDGDGSGDGDQAGLTAYVECLREQGIEVELPSGGFASGAPPTGAGRPSGLPTDLPTDLPTGFPTGRPGGGPGGPGLRPEGVDEETWQEAQEACQSLLPSGGFGPPGGNGGPAADTAWRDCLSDRGVDASDADTTADSAVAEALEACSALSPPPAPSG